MMSWHKRAMLRRSRRRAWAPVISAVALFLVSVLPPGLRALQLDLGALAPKANGKVGKPGKPDKHDKAANSPVPNGPAPSQSIPITPLGFAPPALHYLGGRISQVSLSFLNEDTLLFTFRVPGLIPRERPADSAPVESRRIRAVVLSLPTGQVTAEALWDLHDNATYLWPLKNGRFLLRDRNTVQMGDAALHMSPFLRFPGEVTALELDPDEKLLIANTSEPAATSAQQASKPATRTASATTNASPGSSANGASGSGNVANVTADGDTADASKPQLQNLLRILRMENGSVMLFSRVAGPSHLPLDGDGYFEAIRGSGDSFLISYQDFHGASNPILRVESTCSPALEPVAHDIVLATSCNANGSRTLGVLTRNFDHDLKPQNPSEKKPAKKDDKKHDSSDNRPPGLLWQAENSPRQVWPLVVRAPEGRRFARATLSVTHPIGPSTPLDTEDIRGQSIQVYDIANGNVALSLNASPVFDGGGSFALSPSGQRFALINGDAIQIFDLPAAPPLPPASRP